MNSLAVPDGCVSRFTLLGDYSAVSANEACQGVSGANCWGGPVRNCGAV